MPTWLPAALFCALLFIVPPLMAWHYHNYFNGRYERWTDEQNTQHPDR